MLTAQELQVKRQEQQMTQAQLAQVIGIEAGLIARYEQGELPISAEHETKLQAVWRHPTPAPAASKPRPVKPSGKKAAPARTPSMSKWLQSVAHESPERHAAPSTLAAPAAETAPSRVVQAAAQITSDKRRRAALHSLLTAALSQLDKLFSEDKQLRGMAESIEQLEPAYRQVVLGLVNQFEQLDPAAPSKTRSAPDQLVQTLKDPSAYVTVLNYLEASIKLLKEAELGDRPALMNRLQNLSEFDQNTVQLITKRYQTSSRSHSVEQTPDEERVHGSTAS
jgi:transcriptional regulator with XRE-family HTH domain